MSQTPPWTIVGQGLAGTCLAWHLWWRNVPFVILDDGSGGSSRVAAGLVNPVTGKNFEPSKQIDGFLPEALEFYQKLEDDLFGRFWHPLPVLRLAAEDEEWKKMLGKSGRADIAPWVAGIDMSPADGWRGAMWLAGGGRLDTRAFLDHSREFFVQAGIYQNRRWNPDDQAGVTILCEGASGLMLGRCGSHRCAKGEILTVSAAGWDESHIRVGGGGWLVPLGGGRFKAGATYEWHQLDQQPTPAGREHVESIIRRLAGSGYEILTHEAGIRPIIRRSEPLIGPLADDLWIFNGLGSKGTLYAPGMARRIACWLLDGTSCEPHFDIRGFLQRPNPA